MSMENEEDIYQKIRRRNAEMQAEIDAIRRNQERHGIIPRRNEE